MQRHIELLESDQLSTYDKEYLRGILGGTASETDIAMSFMNLSRMLHAHYTVAPIIIIDEYDTPIQQGYSLGYYDKLISFMQNLFSAELLLWGSAMYFALRLERIKKANNVQSYREILAFSEGRKLDEIEQKVEAGKRPYQKLLLVLLTAGITLLVGMVLSWLLL